MNLAESRPRLGNPSYGEEELSPGGTHTANSIAAPPGRRPFSGLRDEPQAHRQMPQ